MIGKRDFCKNVNLGSERFKSLTANFIVFDLTWIFNFQSIDNLIKLIYENTKFRFLILIGNKSDLVNERKKKFLKKLLINYMKELKEYEIGGFKNIKIDGANVFSENNNKKKKSNK